MKPRHGLRDYKSMELGHKAYREKQIISIKLL